MFRTSFAKHWRAFIIIIFASFLILSAAITTLIQSDITSRKKDNLERISIHISKQIEEASPENFTSYVTDNNGENLLNIVLNLTEYDQQLKLTVVDPSGSLLLTTFSDPEHIEKYGKISVASDGSLGKRNIDDYDYTINEEDGRKLLYYEIDIKGIFNPREMIYGSSVNVGGNIIGYVFASSSTAGEDQIVTAVKRVVTNSSIVVLIAAMFASYIMTERLIQPLRLITETAKKYGKGDFSERIPVLGKDEVSELAVALNNMADSLDSLEKMRNSFLANISHDLRTPMTTISGFIDGITSGAIPEDKHEYYLGVISAEVHRLSRLVTQLLDVSRLESGERKFNFKNFDIAEMARIILISFEQKIENKRLDVAFETEDDVMFVNADEDAIYQVLYNLCHNAIKFSKEGGKFIIKIGMNADKKVQVSVFDEGQGISGEDLRLVFDRFFKTDKSRGLDKNGVGLGLYISKAIMDAHNEKIWVESEEDENCEFFFTLKPGISPEKRGNNVIDGELID